MQFDPQATNQESLSQVVRDLGYDVIKPQPASEGAGEEDLHAVEAKVRETEYRQQKIRFIAALVLTLPVAVLAMAEHIVPALESMLNFPGRSWLELALTAGTVLGRA